MAERPFKSLCSALAQRCGGADQQDEEPRQIKSTTPPMIAGGEAAVADPNTVSHSLGNLGIIHAWNKEYTPSTPKPESLTLRWRESCR
jgi:hypothetical protein